MIITCDFCGKEFECAPKRFRNSKKHRCSKECAIADDKRIRELSPDYLNCICWICGKKFHIKEYQKNKYPTHTCSTECIREAQRRRMDGENNHQFGLTGSLNSSWKSDEKISVYGYKLVRAPEHPFANSDGFIFEHRLIAEKFLLTDENCVEIAGKKIPCAGVRCASQRRKPSQQ